MAGKEAEEEEEGESFQQSFLKFSLGHGKS